MPIYFNLLFLILANVDIIKPNHINQILNYGTTKGLSERSLQIIYSQINRILKEALYTGFLENNPIEKVRRTKAIKTEKVIFRNDQDFINILKDVTKSKNKIFMHFLSLLGKPECVKVN
ncbi:hypothetical protein AZF37_07280 [endosymbiont 'TC1' of Trimyema compressum]|uniref:hypothetical protein n=1 Tax=endosymbiont 'TC1' of Trimyema compressum TaxID=243899 RepID=UPI0007F10352|nr:hypothetical protein [endosymbiont 'TC1' of Trimyema compressum]AMP20989.1 hypothetical protein AZF37_07280 [endosymbiont 'TC1' of Trimyema compressum]